MTQLRTCHKRCTEGRGRKQAESERAQTASAGPATLASGRTGQQSARFRETGAMSHTTGSPHHGHDKYRHTAPNISVGNDAKGNSAKRKTRNVGLRD